MKKRVLAFVMFVSMMISLIPLAGVYAFSDVTEETPYGAAIQKLEEWGKIDGYSDGTFKPEEFITRAEFVKILMSLDENNGLQYVPEVVETGFTDVDSLENYWAARYIKFAVDNKIINGYGDGTFLPENKVTYEEALKMVVCFLGYELKAKAKAEEVGMNLWPDGYIAVANELMITKSITIEGFSSEITRGAVAQIIYNASSVTEVDPETQTPINSGTSTGVVSGGGGGGGGGGRPSGGGGGGNSSINPGNIETIGVIVGTNDIFIDDAAYLENNGRISSAYMIFKEDRSGKYLKLFTGFKAGEEGYTGKIGCRVRLTYREIDDSTVNYEVVSVTDRDTQIITVDAENIYKVENGVFRYEELQGGSWKTESIKYDIANMQFMYNGRVVRNENGTTENMAEMMTEEDLKPEVGSVKLVDTDNNGVADYGVIESYTTIVVDECKTEMVQEDPNDPESKYKKYTVKDKFVKEGEGEAATQKVYTFDDRKLVDENDAEVSPSLSSWDVVYLAQPKDLSKTIIRVSSRSTKKTITVREIDVNGYSIIDSSNKTYTTSQYFLNNVWDTIKAEAQESGIKLELYLDPSGKVAAAQIGEPSYSTGYLIDAAMDQQTGDLILRIVTTGNKNNADSQRYAISNTAKIDGQAVKKDVILQMLEDNALPIQEGKPEHVMGNAKIAQPIRFETNGISKNTNLSLIRNLDIVPVDEEKSFKEDGTPYGGARKYIESSAGKGFGEGVYDIEFLVESNATIILLPNNRLNTEYFQIGTIGSMSKYLKANEYYNVEPYILENTEGDEWYGIFAIYYEDSYAKASTSSPVAIVKEIKDALDDDGEPIKKIETISASTSASTTTTTYSAQAVELMQAKYYGAGEDSPDYEVKPGDVITFGKTMDDKMICNIEILFDVSERNNVNQENHLLLRTSGEAHTDDETEAFYRVALGKIASLPDSDSAQSLATVTVDNDTVPEKFRKFSINAENKTVYGYDPDDPDSEVGSQDENNKTLKLLEYAEVGDFVFVFQTESKERFVYVVKNRAVLTDGVQTDEEPPAVNVGENETQPEEPEEIVEQEPDMVLPSEEEQQEAIVSPEDETKPEESVDEVSEDTQDIPEEIGKEPATPGEEPEMEATPEEPELETSEITEVE